MLLEFADLLTFATLKWDWIDTIYGIGIAAGAIIFVKYIANFIEYVLLHITLKTPTPLDDNLVKVIISTTKISAIVFGIVGFLYYETRFLVQHLLDYEKILIICIYFIITVFSLKILKIGYNEIRKFTQPPKSYFELNMLKAILISLRVILISALVSLIMQTNGFPAMALWVFIGVLASAVFVFTFIIFWEASSTIFIRSNIPITIGDIVRIDGNLGSVVEFGLRFIILLTPENSYVYIPYKVMKDKLLENLTKRQSRRFRFSMHLRWESSANSVNKFLKKINKFLIEHDSIISTESTPVTDGGDADRNDFGEIGNPFAYFVGMSEEGIEILIQYRIEETDFHLGTKISEKILLEILKLAEKEGVKITDEKQSKAAKKSEQSTTASKGRKKDESEKQVDAKVDELKHSSLKNGKKADKTKAKTSAKKKK
ncbi:MAG: mechanosensitive ion channel family protein [Planctomycetes bacterium]|nr:mechanosensitive ion channel family protein [Planctomycetota bacterium]